MFAIRPVVSRQARLLPAITQSRFVATSPLLHPNSRLTEYIKEDHAEMFEFYQQYKAATDEEGKKRWSRQFIWEVARHAAGEEIVVYPLMERYLGAEGKQLADGDRRDHQKVKELLYKIESHTPGSAEYDRILGQVLEHLTRHNTSEEKNDLPALEAVLNEGDSARAGRSFYRTKKLVPTRAHPSAPNKPPFETLAGFLAAPLDKIKDAFSMFPEEEDLDAVEAEAKMKAASDHPKP